MKDSNISWGQHVPELPVLDVDSAQKYYREVLGFDIAWNTGNVRAQLGGERWLYFLQRKIIFTLWFIGYLWKM